MNYLRPGFRFYPTEEELILFYLQNKLDGRREDWNPVVNRVIPVLDIYQFNPWDLPRIAGEVSGRGDSDSEQWFFFVPRQEKVGRGGRPNRQTSTGYWKATGMPMFVYSSTNNRSIGEKRTMVFYIGRAPNGRKTEWKMNEYKALADGVQNPSSTNNIAHPRLREEYCLCRIYKKTKCVRAFDRRPIGPAGTGVIMSDVAGTQKPPFDHHHAAIIPTQQHMTAAEEDYSAASSSFSGEAAQPQPSQAMDTDGDGDVVDPHFSWDLDQLDWFYGGEP